MMTPCTMPRLAKPNAMRTTAGMVRTAVHAMSIQVDVGRSVNYG